MSALGKDAPTETGSYLNSRDDHTPCPKGKSC
uniref:Uncharacterized protein n=1 Tax=Siphoviridae sp. ct3CA7 TaxID=2823561 RepID=A0A8S5LEV9_9CAUD|nr:MAG TPA: hypothetical protein [Siphoviridae sp. ct3CA7]